MPSGPQAFRQLDANQDGVLDRQEWASAADQNWPLLLEAHIAHADWLITVLGLLLHISHHLGMKH